MLSRSLEPYCSLQHFRGANELSLYIKYQAIKNRYIAFIVLVTIDLVTKKIASTLLSDDRKFDYFYQTIQFRYVENPFGFLSILYAFPENIRHGALVYGVFLLLLLGLFILTKIPRQSPLTIPFTAVLGGGYANLIDRLLHHGAVIDFIILQLGPWRTGIFNFADLCILAGSFTLGFLLIQQKDRSTA